MKTSTGIWTVVYNAENRPTSFTNTETNTVIECAYDYMGRRATKKVSVNGSVSLHQRFLYRGYLQIACCDMTRSNHPCLWLITWDPSQPIATRPLAIQKDGTWYTYGWDLTKNICEVYGQHGYIRTNYSYSPYGEVTISGDVTQPIQWSSEYSDSEIDLVYYNYRHYSPCDGKWMGRDLVSANNLYLGIENAATMYNDLLGLLPAGKQSEWGSYDRSKGNCYRYAFNDPAKEGEIPQLQPFPNRNHLYTERDCVTILKAVLSKEGVQSKSSDECPCNYYEVALYIMPAVVSIDKFTGRYIVWDAGDYHWYRKDDDGTWSHKPGSTPVEIGVINPDVDAYYREYTIACNPHICVKGEGTNLD